VASYSDGKSAQIKKEYEKFASENMGIFRIGSVDCTDFPKICENEKVDSTPTIRLYPEFPAPTQDY
jgi:thioredoxin-like negative regulator of GroEL